MTPAFSDHNHMLAYTHIPTAAFRVPDPKLASIDTNINDNSDTFKPGESKSFRSRLASFPPNNVASAGRRGTGPAGALGTTGGVKESTGTTGTGGVGGGIGSALSSGVTDMFISHLLPSALPSKATPQAPLPQPGKIRALSSQRESLSLPGMTNSFRRFVARCGTIFWVEDRVEEVLYWRKPVWTWSWMLLWSFICFYPKILLLIPSCTIILILLNEQNKVSAKTTTTSTTTTSASHHPAASPTVPAPPKSSLLNNALTASIAATLTQNNDPAVNPKTRQDGEGTTGRGDDRAHGTAVDVNGREIQAVTGAPPESGVDYYMNLQGIQNFMGLFSDVYDAVLPFIALIVPSMASPSPPPTTFPLSSTHLMMLLLPPTIMLPLIPLSILSYLLLPIGIVPPIIYHPNFLPTLERFKAWQGIEWRRWRYWRGKAERWVLTDRLDDSIARSEIREVRVWENQRLDPGWVETRLKSIKAGTGSGGGGGGGGSVASAAAETRSRSGSGSKTLDLDREGEAAPESAWSTTHLKSFERAGWVRTLPKFPNETLWQDESGDAAAAAGATTTHHGRVALSLKREWCFVPGEDWRVDLVAEWDRDGGDEAGWVYGNDEWQNPSPEPILEIMNPETGEREVVYLVTRRRQWWRRVYSTDDMEGHQVK